MSLEEKLANAKETHWIEELTSEKSEEVASSSDYQPTSVRLGNNIKKYMQQNNVTVADIVEKTSFSEGDINRLLSGDLFISPKDIKELADVIGVTKRELIRGVI